MVASGKDGDVGVLPTLQSAGPRPVTGDRLAVNTAVGDYVIDRFIGAGGMGEVYAGHHPVIGKKVAIKVIRSQLAASAEAIERFTREARAVNQVDHPNVVDVFAIGRLDDGRLYLVMDLVDGESLRARIQRGPIAAREAIAILEPIAAAVDAAHARGVVHRDLKPDNVMVAGTAERPNVKVLDFGVAKLVSSVADPSAPAPATLTGQGTWLGTPAYMAPEQWAADGAIAASDRYALAITTYEMLAGALPFEASTAPALMEKHFRAEVPALSTMKGVALPPAVDDVLRRGLAKDPETRFVTATALLDALVAAIGDRSSRPIKPARAGAAPRRVGALPMVAGGIALAVTGFGVYVVAGDRGGDRAPNAPVANPADGGPTVEVLTTPTGAQVVVGGALVGVTPRRVPLGDAGAVDVEIRKPGYVPEKRTLAAADKMISVSLQPVVGFEGVWAMKDGELRRFRRDGEVVVAFKLAAAGDQGTFYRRFEFDDAPGSTVVFKAVEDHVDERAPDEPSCNVPLQARYEYDPGGDELELHKERIALEFRDGRCFPSAKEWGPPQLLSRIRGASDTSAWVESRAGGASPDPKQPPPPVQKPRTTPVKKAPPRKQDVGGETSKRPNDDFDAKTRGTVQANKLASPPPDEQKNDAPDRPPPQTQQAAPPPPQQEPQVQKKSAPPPNQQLQLPVRPQSQGQIEPEGSLDIPNADQQRR